MDITDSIHLFANNPYKFTLKFKREIIKEQYKVTRQIALSYVPMLFIIR